MKKRQLIWIGLIGVIMASCGGKYKITGKTNLISDGETILLQKQNNEQFEIVDSATVTNGSFSFKGEQKSPAIAILVHLNEKQSQIPPQLIALEKGDIYVTLDSVSHISGTPLNDRLQMYETKTPLLRYPHTKHYEPISERLFIGTIIRQHFCNIEKGLR